MYVEIHGLTVTLIDDGTLDTVLEVSSEERSAELRFNGESAAHYRDPDTGAMTERGFRELAQEAVEDFYESEVNDEHTA